MLNILLLALSTMVCQAAPQQASKANQKSKEMSFEEILIQGKYQFSDEAVTTVEQDKVLEGLIGLKKDFKERMEESMVQK